MTRRRGTPAALLTLLLALTPAAASASPAQESIIEDDAQFVLSGPAARERALADVVELGADTVHSVVFWNRVAPRPDATTRPAGFDGSDPAAYPPALWDGYDGLVRGAAARGIDILLSPSSPMPAWASGCATATLAVRRTCRPNPTQYKRFVQALGTRYSGTYADENENRAVLPRVARWSVWNEPNQGGWLQPQYVRSRGRLVAYSPVAYRALVRAAVRGLAASGHARDELLFGETAPLGRTTGRTATRPIPPVAFYRAAFCLDARGRALTGRAARDLDCSGFARLPVTGIAHHPYTRGGSQPPTTKGGPDEITISSVSRLERILDQAGRRGRIRAGLPVHYTEFGFQTSPPDAISGVSLDDQAAYLNHADFIAYRSPRVRSVAQYEVRDEPALGGFQSGLRFLDGTIKPGFVAYRLPLWVSRSGSRLRVWGQVRPLPDGATARVDVQHAPPGSGAFRTLTRAQTRGAKGFVDVRLAPRRGSWRLRWTPPGGGPPITSRTAVIDG